MSTSDVPTLETERLILRGHETRDLARATSMWSNPEVIRYTTGVPSNEQRTWQRIMAYRGHWALLGFGYWALEEKKSGRFVGELGFADFKRGYGPEFDPYPEMGWALAPEFHRQGFATEALQRALVWGKSNLKSKRSVCVIQTANPVSLKLAANLGFRLFRSIKDPNGDQEWLSLDLTR